MSVKDWSAINYLKIFGANSYGHKLNKDSFENRIKFINQNLEDIINFENGNLLEKAENKKRNYNYLIHIHRIWQRLCFTTRDLLTQQFKLKYNQLKLIRERNRLTVNIDKTNTHILNIYLRTHEYKFWHTKIEINAYTATDLIDLEQRLIELRNKKRLLPPRNLTFLLTTICPARSLLTQLILVYTSCN